MERDEFIEVLDDRLEQLLTQLDDRFVRRDICDDRTRLNEQRLHLIYGAYTFTAVAFATLVSWLVFK